MTESSRPPLVAIRQAGGIAGLVLIAAASWWVLAVGAASMGILLAMHMVRIEQLNQRLASGLTGQAAAAKRLPNPHWTPRHAE